MGTMQKIPRIHLNMNKEINPVSDVVLPLSNLLMDPSIVCDEMQTLQI